MRYLRNVMGLWLLQECQREWRIGNIEPLLRDASRVPALRAVVDPDDPDLLPPGNMPARIDEACCRAGQPVPQAQAQTVRCILDSLALAHRSTLAEAQRLSGRDIDVVHIVGGGARNDLLCQLTADACGLPVLAGPVEATALGNVLVQARALGSVGACLADMRALVRATHPVRSFEPHGNAKAWREAAAHQASRAA